MNCTKCGKEYSQSDKYCCECGNKLISANFVSGNESLNIAGHNTITNSNLHVGDLYQGEKPEEIAYIDRTYIKPIIIAGSPVRTSWFIISGLIGFIGSWASIFSALGGSWQFLFILFMALSMFLFLNGIKLWKTRFSRLLWFNFESNSDGEVFFTKVGGSCPKCDGTLRLTDIKVSQNHSKTYVRCSRNSDHIWNFDPTVLN